MKRSFFIAISLLAMVSSAGAQNLEPAVLRELKGQAPAAQRTPEQLQIVYDQAIKALLISKDGQHNPQSAAALVDFEAVYLNASRPGAEAERLAMSKAIMPLTAAATPKESRVR